MHVVGKCKARVNLNMREELLDKIRVKEDILYEDTSNCEEFMVGLYVKNKFISKNKRINFKIYRFVKGNRIKMVS